MWQQYNLHKYRLAVSNPFKKETHVFIPIPFVKDYTHSTSLPVTYEDSHNDDLDEEINNHKVLVHTVLHTLLQPHATARTFNNNPILANDNILPGITNKLYIKKHRLFNPPDIEQKNIAHDILQNMGEHILKSSHFRNVDPIALDYLSDRLSGDYPNEGRLPHEQLGISPEHYVNSSPGGILGSLFYDYNHNNNYRLTDEEKHAITPIKNAFEAFMNKNYRSLD